MAGKWTPATGVLPVGAVGEPATKRTAGVTGSIEPQDRRVKPGHRARSGKVSGGTVSDDPSRSRCTYCAGLRGDHRERGTLWLRQTGGELSRPGPAGKIQRESAAAGAHHQTGEFDRAFLTGRSGASHRAHSARMAQQVSPPDDSARTKDSQSCHGA